MRRIAAEMAGAGGLPPGGRGEPVFDVKRSFRGGMHSPFHWLWHVVSRMSVSLLDSGQASARLCRGTRQHGRAFDVLTMVLRGRGVGGDGRRHPRLASCGPSGCPSILGKLQSNVRVYAVTFLTECEESRRAIRAFFRTLRTLA